MNATEVLTGLHEGLTAVTALSRIAGNLGINSEVINIAGSLASIGSNAIQHIEEGKIVASSRDRTLIEGYTKALSAVNDTLANEIANS